MPSSLQFIYKTIPGYGPPDGRCLPCSGVPGRAMSMSQYSSPCDHRFIADIKFLSLNCATRHTSSVCNATPNNYRRSPDFPRQNKQGFSRNRNNRHNNEERDGYDDFEDSDSSSSKNGSLLSFSGNQKFQATSTPGPREKEIVELFRKVQAQLRERAAKKEDKKVEDSQVKSKENETVDSLLKLLRKHSVQQGKKNTNNVNNREFILDHPEQVSPPTKEKSPKISDSINTVKPEIIEIPTPNLSRPKSNFQKRSPVPEIKFQPIYTEGSVNSVSHDSLDVRRKGIKLDPESGTFHKLEIESDSESDSESLLPEGDVFNESLDDTAEEQNPPEAINLSGMKLTELRALAKSRGMKGFSKLKKTELIDILSGSAI